MERNRVVRRINRIKENNNDLGFAIVDKTILKIFFIKMFGVFKFGEKNLWYNSKKYFFSPIF